MDKDLLKMFGVIAIIAVITIFLTSFGIRKSCLDSYADYQPSWGLFTNCRVVWDGKLTPVDIVREIK